MSEDAGIEPRTVATTALAARRSNHWLDLIHLLPILGGPQTSSANSQIRKFVDFNTLLDLRTFLKCGTLRIWDLRTQAFCDLRT